MQALAAADNRSWIYWAGYHGFPNYYCWHHSAVGTRGPFPYNLFLPWHRAYLVYWENIMRDQSAQAVLPWWDWTSDLSHQAGIPQAFTDQTVDGNANPLFDGPTPDMPNDPARRTQRSPGDPGELPTQEGVNDLLGLNSFVDFSNQVEDVHDGVHGWVGGDMGIVAQAAFDPIFWSHHAMIDRIWYLWQVQNGVTNIPPDYLDQTLAPFGYTVRQVLDIHQLGYEYGTSTATDAGTESTGIDGGRGAGTDDASTSGEPDSGSSEPTDASDSSGTSGEDASTTDSGAGNQ
jgi:tyrosinase